MTKKKEIVKAVKFEDSNKKIRIGDDGLDIEFEDTQENMDKAFQGMSGVNDRLASNVLITGAAESSSLRVGKETEAINVTFALLEAIAPQDALEGMLAAQMVACHNMAMEMAKRAMHPEQSSAVATQCVTRSTKLMNTFTSQVDSLQKYRNKGQQVIKVQHVTVNEGGQAIVGDVKGGVD